MPVRRPCRLRATCARRLSTLILICLLAVAAAAHADGHRAPAPAAWDALLTQSMNEKFGLTFYVRGQVIPGIVTAIGDDGAIEVRNQTHDRIVIRRDRIDALGR